MKKSYTSTVATLILCFLFSAVAYAGGPKITFIATTVNAGNVKQGEVVKGEFKFRNDGTSPLRINSVEKACGMKSVEFPTEAIEPGSEGTITVTFDSNHMEAPGLYRRGMMVKHNGGAQVNLLFKCNVESAENTASSK